MLGTPGDSLIDLCAGASELVIAAPYIKAEALTRILEEVNPTAPLTCVTRWHPQDIAAGVSDTSCRVIVLRRGGSFRLHPSLHAKYYRAGDSVLVGSANLTAAAMGWSRQSNLEILCHPATDFSFLEFERELLQQSRAINDDEFARWEAITTIDIPNQFPVNTDFHNPLEEWRPSTRDPRNLGLSYQGREQLIASFDEQQAAKRDIQTLQTPSGFTDYHFRNWITVGLLSSGFTIAVIELLNEQEPGRSRILANSFGLSPTEARRDMETVHNWLAFFAPDILAIGL